MIILKPSIGNFKGLFQREIIGLATLSIIVVYFAHQSQWSTLIPFLLAIAFVIDWAPAIYFTLSYYKINKGQEFKLDSNSIEVRKNGNSDRYTKDEIEEIEIFMSGNNPRFNIAYSAMEFFHYARLKMKNGEQIIITSLCAEQVDVVLEEHLKGVPLEYNWGFPNIGRLNRKCSY